MTAAADGTGERWQRLTALVVEVSDRVHDAQQVRPETDLFDDLGLSSMMAVNLVVDLERAFDIVIREADFDGLRTVGDLQRVVETRTREQSP